MRVCLGKCMGDCLWWCWSVSGSAPVCVYSEAPSYEFKGFSFSLYFCYRHPSWLSSFLLFPDLVEIPAQRRARCHSGTSSQEKIPTFVRPSNGRLFALCVCVWFSLCVNGHGRYWPQKQLLLDKNPITWSLKIQFHEWKLPIPWRQKKQNKRTKIPFF